MSLLDAFSKECVLLVKTRVQDPVGGYKTVWVDGTSFTAAWEFNDAPEITVAEQQGVARIYDIYVDKTLDLDYHEAFRRKDNGQIYRVTNPGKDRHTPGFSLLNKRVIRVEEWELPNEETSGQEGANVPGSGST